jgi:hypothetical protein
MIRYRPIAAHTLPAINLSCSKMTTLRRPNPRFPSSRTYTGSHFTRLLIDHQLQLASYEAHTRIGSLGRMKNKGERWKSLDLWPSSQMMNCFSWMINSVVLQSPPPLRYDKRVGAPIATPKPRLHLVVDPRINNNNLPSAGYGTIVE